MLNLKCQRLYFILLYFCQPQPSTSTTPDDTCMADLECDVAALYQACPNLNSLELINTGFNQSVVHSSTKPLLYQPW